MKKNIIFVILFAISLFADSKNEVDLNFEFIKKLSNSNLGGKKLTSTEWNYYINLCKNGNSSLCKSLAEASLDKRNEFGNEKIAQDFYNKAFEILDLKCKNSSEECGKLASLYATKEFNAYDLNKSNEYNIKYFNFINTKCSTGDWNSCRSVARMYIKGKGTIKNISKAIEIFKNFCSLNNESACYNLAYLYFHKIKDKNEALRFYKKTCDLGVDVACYEVARNFYYDNYKVNYENMKSAVKYFSKSNNYRYLPELTTYYFEKNNEKFFEINSIAYNNNYKESAWLLGYAHINGLGIQKDYFKAFKYFDESCNNFKEGCSYLGILYEYGQGVRQNLSLAKESYGKACDNGDQDSCNKYKLLNQ